MNLYHYTLRDRLTSILEQGLRPGSEVGLGEALPVILFDRRPYRPKVGGMVYLQVELEEEDPEIYPLNESWVAYRGRVPAERIVAVADPPRTNDEVIGLLVTGGKEAVDRAFDYVPR